MVFVIYSLASSWPRFSPVALSLSRTAFVSSSILLISAMFIPYQPVAVVSFILLWGPIQQKTFKIIYRGVANEVLYLAMEKSKDSFFCSMNIFFNTVLEAKPLELDTHKFVTCLKRILNGWKLIKWSHGRSWIIFSQIIWPIPRHILILNNLIYHNGDSIFALNCVIIISK